MRQCRSIPVVLTLLLCGLGALANVPPTMDDEYITTVEGKAVTFELRAEDEDIDPSNPAVHPLTFTILDGPHHGVLVGDFLDVRYRGPHEAVVDVTYIPAQGFVGTDYVTLSVMDPFDESASGTVTIRIDVEAKRMAGILSGTVKTEVTLDVQTGECTVFQTSVTEVYRINQLTLKGTAELKMETVGTVKHMTFDALRFEGRVSLSDLSFASTVAFDPDAGLPADMFESWRTTTRFQLGGVLFTHTSYLPNNLSDSYQTLMTRVEIGSHSIVNTLRFDAIDGCGLGFSKNRLTATWSRCDVSMRAELLFTDAGFQEVSFGARGIPVPTIVWLPDNIGMNVEVTFAPNAKSLSAAFEWRPEWDGCIRACAELITASAGAPPVSGDTKISGISIYGLIVDCPLPGDIHLRSATSFDDTKNLLITGQTDYFESFRIAGSLAGCCGIPGTWSIATFFLASSTQLFDWGMTRARADVGISDYLSASFELTSRSGELGDSTCELTLGWTARW